MDELTFLLLFSLFAFVIFFLKDSYMEEASTVNRRIVSTTNYKNLFCNSFQIQNVRLYCQSEFLLC